MSHSSAPAPRAITGGEGIPAGVWGRARRRGQLRRARPRRRLDPLAAGDRTRCGRRAVGHRRQPLHRSPVGARPDDPRPRAPRDDRGRDGRDPRSQHDVRAALRAGGGGRPRDRPGRAVGRARALLELRNRGRAARDADRPRRDRTHAGRALRGPVPRVGRPARVESPPRSGQGRSGAATQLLARLARHPRGVRQRARRDAVERRRGDRGVDDRAWR